jgi:hypothetical protein
VLIKKTWSFAVTLRVKCFQAAGFVLLESRLARSVLPLLKLLEDVFKLAAV